MLAPTLLVVALAAPAQRFLQPELEAESSSVLDRSQPVQTKRRFAVVQPPEHVVQPPEDTWLVPLRHSLFHAFGCAHDYSDFREGPDKAKVQATCCTYTMLGVSFLLGGRGSQDKVVPLPASLGEVLHASSVKDHEVAVYEGHVCGAMHHMTVLVWRDRGRGRWASMQSFVGKYTHKEYLSGGCAVKGAGLVAMGAAEWPFVSSPGGWGAEKQVKYFGAELGPPRRDRRRRGPPVPCSSELRLVAVVKKAAAASLVASRGKKKGFGMAMWKSE